MDNGNKKTRENMEQATAGVTRFVLYKIGRFQYSMLHLFIARTNCNDAK